MLLGLSAYIGCFAGGVFVIKITDVSKKYGNRIILENVSCSLDDQRIYALVGVNGIGKSTLLNAITQSADMDSGKVEIDGI